MSDEHVERGSEPWMKRSSPAEVIDAVIRQGDPKKRGLRPYIEALAYARWQKWTRLEVEQYVKLGLLLDRFEGMLDPDVIERLHEEITHTTITDDVDAVLKVLLGALTHIPADHPTVENYLCAFEVRTEQPATAWPTRRLVGEFLTCVESLNPPLATESRRRLTRKLPDWALEYHATDAVQDFELRSRAMFNCLEAAEWDPSPVVNVEKGIEGAFTCVIDKFMEGSRQSWFCDFTEGLGERLGGQVMYRRLTPETLYRIGQTLSRARRRVYQRDHRAALAITALEDAIHRPHRLQLERAPVRLELELPGPRGFGEGLRLRVFDISRDGCLAMVEGPARFEETSLSREFQLERGPGRAWTVRRLTGVVQRENDRFGIRPETELILHDISDGDRDWAAIDRASLVRFSRDDAANRLWLGFHFDRVVPVVQQEIEELVYSAA